MKITLPNNWHGVTIGQFIELSKVPTDIADTDILLHRISILSGISIEQAEMIKMADLSKIIRQLSFLSEPISGNTDTTWRHGNKRYKFLTDLRDIDLGTYITISSFTKSQEESKANMHKVCAALTKTQEKRLFKWRDKVISNQLSDFEDKAKLFYHQMPVTLAHTFAAFFLHVWQNSLPLTKIYLERMKKGMESNLTSQKTSEG